jgi:hypothetical protein
MPSKIVAKSLSLMKFRLRINFLTMYLKSFSFDKISFIIMQNPELKGLSSSTRGISNSRSANFAKRPKTGFSIMSSHSFAYKTSTSGSSDTSAYIPGPFCMASSIYSELRFSAFSFIYSRISSSSCKLTTCASMRAFFETLSFSLLINCCL